MVLALFKYIKKEACRSFIFHIHHLKSILLIPTALLGLVLALLAEAAAHIAPDIRLYVGEGDVYFWVFEFVVLVETAFTAV